MAYVYALNVRRLGSSSNISIRFLVLLIVVTAEGCCIIVADRNCPSVMENTLMSSMSSTVWDLRRVESHKVMSLLRVTFTSAPRTISMARTPSVPSRLWSIVIKLLDQNSANLQELLALPTKKSELWDFLKMQGFQSWLSWVFFNPSSVRTLADYVATKSVRAQWYCSVRVMILAYAASKTPPVIGVHALGPSRTADHRVVKVPPCMLYTYDLPWETIITSNYGD